jgi:hypothetical protein
MGKNPISDVAKIDLLGERHDGGLDMVIVAEGPLDKEPETLNLVSLKVRNYAREALDSSFRQRWGGIEVERVRILLESRFDIDPEVHKLISTLAQEVIQQGLRFELRRYDREEP